MAMLELIHALSLPLNLITYWKLMNQVTFVIFAVTFLSTSIPWILAVTLLNGTFRAH